MGFKPFNNSDQISEQVFYSHILKTENMKKLTFILFVALISLGLTSCTEEAISESNKLTEGTQSCCGDGEILPPPKEKD